MRRRYVLVADNPYDIHTSVIESNCINELMCEATYRNNGDFWVNFTIYRRGMLFKKKLIRFNSREERQERERITEKEEHEYFMSDCHKS